MSGAISFGEWSWRASTSLVQSVVQAVLETPGLDGLRSRWDADSQYFFATNLSSQQRGIFVDAVRSLELSRIEGLPAQGVAKVKLLQEVATAIFTWADAPDSAIVKIQMFEATAFSEFSRVISEPSSDLKSLAVVELSMMELRRLDEAVFDRSDGLSIALFEPGPRVYGPMLPHGIEGIRLARELRRRQESELPSLDVYFSFRNSSVETPSAFEFLDERWAYIRDIDHPRVKGLRPLLDQHDKAIAISLGP